MNRISMGAWSGRPSTETRHVRKLAGLDQLTIIPTNNSDTKDVEIRPPHLYPPIFLET